MTRRVFATIFTAALSLTASAAIAQIWDGDGSTANWSEAANWFPDGVPANNGTASIVFDGDGIFALPNADVPWSINSLQFGNAAGDFEIVGSALTIGGGGITSTNQNFVQNTVANPLVLATSQLWSSDESIVTVSGNIDLGSHTLTLDTPGTGRVDLVGQISGTGALVINAPVTWLGFQAHSYTGGTTVNGGATGNPSSLRGVIDLNSTGFLYFEPVSETGADNGTFRGAITGGGRVTIVDVAIGFDPADSTVVDADIELHGTLRAAAPGTLSFGQLILGKNSTLDLASDVNGGSDVSFAQSSGGSNWGGFTLSIVNYTANDRLRFGTSSAGLSATQLSLMRFVEFNNAPGRIDANGFVTPDVGPIITSPLGASAVFGRLFVYQFVATDATSLDATGLPDGLIFDPELRAIYGVPEDTGEFEVALSASNASGTSNVTLVITVEAAPGGPVITSSTAVTARTGQPFRFQVITAGGTSETRLSASGLPPGLTVDSMSGLLSGTVTVDGSFAVTLTATDPNGTSSATLQMTFTSDPAVPVIVSSKEASLVEGQPFSYSIQAPVSGPNDPVTYALIGDLPPGLGFDPSNGVISGTFTPSAAQRPARGKPLTGGVITNVQIFATNSRGTGTTPLVFFLAPNGVVNIATRLAVSTGDNVLIGGFIITGNAPKKVIIRAIGPSLRSGGNPLPGSLQNPTLQLRDAARALLGENDDWRSLQEQEILDTTIAPTDDRESAIVATLNPGSYTAIIAGSGDTTGIGLVEVYDLGTASLESSSQAKFANLSTRGFVQRDNDIMIGGLIVSGSGAKVIGRAIGPSLGAAGVAGALPDTTLEFIDGNGALILANDDWRTGGQEQQIIETTVQPSDDRESAVVATLTPGGYTAVVRGKDGVTGVGLVEVYVLQ